MRIALLGASGFTGSLIDERFRASGIDATLVDDIGALDTTAAGHDLIVTAVGPFVERGPEIVAACLRHGTNYVGIGGEQPYFEHVYEAVSLTPKSSSLVISAGFHFLIGDILATIAVRHLPEPPVEVHTAYYLHRPLRTLLAAPSGTRRSVVGLLGMPVTVRRNGQWVQERVAETRRLAWFPKPVGPFHAAAVPGLEALSIPRRFPTVTTARTYLAMPSWQAESLQALGAMARDDRRRAWLTDRVAASGRTPGASSRAANRWACVAEAADGAGTVVRAWANGTDTYGLTAAAVASIVRRVATGDSLPSGVVAPGDLEDGAGLLDELADAVDLRWSVVTP